MTCRHCYSPRALYSRGLCKSCFHTPEIKALYPAGEKFNPDQHWPRGHEPTMEELEAMIRERLPTMPQRRAGEE